VVSRILRIDPPKSMWRPPADVLRLRPTAYSLWRPTKKHVTIATAQPLCAAKVDLAHVLKRLTAGNRQPDGYQRFTIEFFRLANRSAVPIASTKTENLWQLLNNC
jgi:hypothetical protein